MPEEHILAIGDGITPAGYIQNQVNKLKEAIHMYWGRYPTGWPTSRRPWSSPPKTRLRATT